MADGEGVKEEGGKRGGMGGKEQTGRKMRYRE